MRSTLSRRDVILGSLLAGASLGIPGVRRAAFALAQEPEAKVDPTSRALFDATDLALNNGNGFAGKDNESGALGWGGSYTLQAYLLMYRAYRDTKYLDKLVDQFDQFLAQRDSVRGVKDYRGLSLPAWRCTSDYTCGSIVLNDASGKAAMEIRTAVRPAWNVAISVVAGGNPGTFTLKATTNPDKHTQEPPVDVYENLTLANAAAQINDDFARINATDAGPRGMITAKAVDGANAPPAVSGPTQLAPGAYVYAVQVGQITTPAAAFVRLVHETPELHAKYKAKGDEFLSAIVQAADVFDHEWREDKDTKEGWYIWAKGCPNPFDGADLPHNQYLALGRTMIHLAAIAPDAGAREKYKDRATKMARAFKNDLKTGPKDTYIWSYFWTKGWPYRGWKEADDVSEYQPTMVSPKRGGHKAIEDTSHGHLDVDFARLALDIYLGVFYETDM
jgi:hypothetical protein